MLMPSMVDNLMPYSVAAFVICIVALSVYYFKRRRSSNENIRGTKIENRDINFLNVFEGVSFADAVSYNVDSSKIHNDLLSKINKATNSAGDEAVITVKIIDVIKSRNLILAKFPDHAQKLLKSGKLVEMTTNNGEKILIATSKKTGSIVAHARKVDPGMVSKLSNIATGIVSAAHIISGYDNSKRLKSIQGKVNDVLRLMSQDKVATLEAAFETVKELSSRVPSDSELNHLRNVKFKLKELRSIWFANVNDKLLKITNPDKRSWWQRKVSQRDSSLFGNIQNQFDEIGKEISLMRFSVQLELIISELLMDGDVFRDRTLPDIIFQLQETKHLVSERQHWLSKISNLSDKLELISRIEAYSISLQDSTEDEGEDS